MGRRVILLCQVTVLVLFILLFIHFQGKYSSFRRSVVLKSVHINIEDSLAVRFITKESVEASLDELNIILGESRMDTLPLDDLERTLINSSPYIRDAALYVDIFGRMNVSVEQFIPLFRMTDSKGLSYFIDRDKNVVAQSGSTSQRLLVVSQEGDFVQLEQLSNISNRDSLVLTDGYSEGVDRLELFVKLADFIKSSDTYSALFTQVNITKSGDVELFPRIGEHYIVFSSMDSLHNYKSSFRKMDKFYHSQSANGVWTEYSVVNLKYDGQVVCKKKR